MGRGFQQILPHAVVVGKRLRQAHKLKKIALDVARSKAELSAERAQLVGLIGGFGGAQQKRAE